MVTKNILIIFLSFNSTQVPVVWKWPRQRTSNRDPNSPKFETQHFCPRVKTIFKFLGNFLIFLIFKYLLTNWFVPYNVDEPEMYVTSFSVFHTEATVSIVR